MKPRARKVALAVAALGAGVVGVLVVLNRGAVRDHVEAWTFQLTRPTKMVQPLLVGGNLTISWPAQVSARTREPDPARTYPVEENLFRIAASEFRCPVIFDPEEMPATVRLRTLCNIRGFLAATGWRVIEQRFPRRAYVVIRDKAAEGTP